MHPKVKELKRKQDKLSKKHEEYYFRLVNLYQRTIEKYVTIDDKEEVKFKKDFIFKKINAMWIVYCNKQKGNLIKLDSYLFYNEMKLC